MSSVTIVILGPARHCMQSRVHVIPELYLLPCVMLEQQEWARAAKQEEDMLMKLKAASLSGSPSAYRQTALTDKHGRLKHGAEKAAPSAQADDAFSKASKQSRASKQGAESKPK